MTELTGRIGCAVVGYGAMHNFGRTHCKWIEESPNLRLVGVCDGDSARLEAATTDFPHVLEKACVPQENDIVSAARDMMKL